MPQIEAAGGCVVDLSKNKPRYLLIHRPAYDDWSFPKGKLNRGESHRQAAQREVLEETGFTCEIKGRLSSVRYITPAGNPKKVRYWLMERLRGTFKPNSEVDAVTWLKRSQALTLLTNVYDQAVLVEAHMLVKNLKRLKKAPR